MSEIIKLSVQKLIGKGYNNGWYTNCHCRYRVFAGARNTKKSYVIIGLEVLCKIISNPLRNVLILRQIGANNRYSTFTTICMLIHTPDSSNPNLSFDRYFKINNSSMTIIYKPTGQQIIFGGVFPDPTRITSMRMARGYLTDVYVEEAYELKSWEEWRRIDGTIRGKLPKGLFHQITFCLNPWNKNHWLYEHFFQGRLEDDFNALSNNDYIDFRDDNLIIDFGKGLYLHKSTYKINEFRDTEIYDLAMEELKKVAPEIYKVEALGMWGGTNGQTYPHFNEDLIQEPPLQSLRYVAIGIDTGYSNGSGKIVYDKNMRLKSATTMQLVGLTYDNSSLYAVDEYFFSNQGKIVPKTAPQILQEIIETLAEWINHKYRFILQDTVCVYVDCADLASRQELELLARQNGLYNLKFFPSTKISIQTRVDFINLIMAFGECKFSKNCPNLIREIKNSQSGANGEPREDFDDHAINSWEYARQPIIRYLKRWGSFKQR